MALTSTSFQRSLFSECAPVSMVPKRVEQRSVPLLLQLSQRSNDLIHLIAFGMTANGLQVELIPRPRCSENVVASTDAWFAKKLPTDRH
jgi:hypothetical protein